MPDTRLIVGLIAALCSAAPAVAQSPTAPGRFTAYYSWPSSVNGTYAVGPAAAVFAAYDLVVLGDGLQDLTHPDHANTVAIIAAAPGTKFLGYVSIGQSTVGYTLAQIQARIAAWAAMGVRGMLLDEGGYDYGVSRTRLNASVDLVHAYGLEALANVWIPADAFDPAVVPLNAIGGGNPNGLATHLGPSDHYLLESFFIENSAFQDPVFAHARAAAAWAYRQTFGTRIQTVTTSLQAAPFDQAQSDYAWWQAQLQGFDGYGWGEPIYSALTASLPYRARPNPGTLGSAWVTDVIHAPALGRDQRLTDLGTIRVDGNAHLGEFRRALISGPSTALLGGATSWIAAAPGAAGWPYVAVATEATAPGIPLSDGRTLPVYPGVLFNLSLTPNPFLVGFSGALSNVGTATLALVAPPEPALAGFAFALDFAVIDLGDPAVAAVFSQPHLVTLN